MVNNIPEADYTLPDDSLWLVLARLLNGRDSISTGFRRDFFGRPLVCTPYDGCYGRAGWILCVEGSPPRGTVLFGASSGAHEVLIYTDNDRARRLYQTEAARQLWAFHDRYLKGIKGPCVFRSPSPEE